MKIRSTNHHPALLRLHQTTPQELSEKTQDRFEASKASFKKELVLQSGGRAVIGGALGYVLSGGAWWGPLAGAGLGVFTAFDKTFREESGKATVTLDGKTSERRIYGDPKDVPLTPEEAAVVTLAANGTGRIAPYAPKGKDIPNPSPEQLAKWKPAAQTLKALEKQRRLVAPFGKTSSDGQPAVHVIDAINAVKLAAAGKPVYVVNAEAAKDQLHTLNVFSINGSHKKAHAENHEYLERSVNYELQRLTDPGQQFPKAHGVPAQMLGLLENAGRFGDVLHVAADNQNSITDSPEFGTRPITKHDDSWNIAQSRVSTHNPNGTYLTRKYSVNFPAFFALLGGTAGMGAAMAVVGPGVPGPVMLCGALGFFGGRQLGRTLNDRI